jgi:geranylgeranyl pyrophosphate synthase
MLSFVESLMLWGMGLTLTEEEDSKLESIVFPCYAVLGLTNDYFSFDREWKEFEESQDTTMTNAVCLLMELEKIDVETAKTRLREEVIKYEKEFLRRQTQFATSQPAPSEKLLWYLRALAYQVSGNTVWSLKCPRYHAEYRYDPNASLENVIEKQRELGSLEDPKEVLRMNKAVGSEVGCGSNDIQLSVNTNHQRAPSLSESTHSESSGSKIERWESDSNDSPTSSAPTDSSDMGDAIEKLALEDGGPDVLDPRHVANPYDYINSLPSKGVRDAFIDAIGIWIDVPEAATQLIKKAGNLLHNASLMLDDVEDGSELRRGKPAVHTIYGVPLTINSATYQIIEALEVVRQLNNPYSIEIFVEEMRNLHIGQSYDLYWTRNVQSQSEEEYLEMVDKKTGGHFRLLSRLMVANGSRGNDLNLDRFVTLVGRHFQIRDDYQNLASRDYWSQKGFCEDLDEGKISYPVMHALNANPTNLQLQAIFQQRNHGKVLSKWMKEIVLEHLEQSGSLEYTKKTLQRLHSQIDEEISQLERFSGISNWVMRLLVRKLKV